MLTQYLAGLHELCHQLTSNTRC